jgi:GT2 family glycosyltransferase
MDLSVIILTYNNREVLKACIDSVVKATKALKYEIIVVDNASSDGTMDMVRGSFPQAKIVLNAMNVGFSKANNKGIKASSGKYVCLLNDDVVVLDGAFDTLVSFMESEKAAGGCGPLLLNTDGTPQKQGSVLGSRFWSSEKTRETEFLMGACLLMKRDVLDQVGLLDENYFFYNEDLDICKMVRRTGKKLFIVPSARVTHIGGHSSRGRFNKRMFVEGFRGGMYFCRKFYGTPASLLYRTTLLLLLLPAMLLEIVSTITLRSGALKDKLLAYLEIGKIALLGPLEHPWPETIGKPGKGS